MKSFIALYVVLIAIISTAIAALPMCYVNGLGVADCSSTPKGPSDLQLLMSRAGPRAAPWMHRVQQTADHFADVKMQAKIWQHQAQLNINKFKSVIPNVNLTSANEWINTAAANVQTAIENQETSEFGAWIKVASEISGLNSTLENLKVLKVEDLPGDIWEYIQENSGQTAFYVVAGVAFVCPGAFTAPLLKLTGFKKIGIRAKTLASLCQHSYGAAVPAGSWLATCTSAGMGGYGKVVLNGMWRFGSLAAGVVKAGMGSRNRTAEETNFRAAKL
ncbi:hypothetical protein LTS10_002230 [Elasticomyces elasticus]|nr:hypothetical protein LTS10_002230 [Elasticomyces elasticus]